MNRAVIIHGWEGNTEEGWMPWLKDELVDRGWNVQVPQMPNALLPKLNEWLETLRLVVNEPSQQVFLIGHSLGCYTILKYLEQLPKKAKIGGVVMVAGFAGNLKHNIPVLTKFYESGLDWEKVKSHCSNFVAIGSGRDDYVHIQSLDEFENNLDAKTIINNDWEHFSGVEGIKELPDVLNAVLGMSHQ